MIHNSITILQPLLEAYLMLTHTPHANQSKNNLIVKNCSEMGLKTLHPNSKFQSSNPKLRLVIFTQNEIEIFKCLTEEQESPLDGIYVVYNLLGESIPPKPLSIIGIQNTLKNNLK